MHQSDAPCSSRLSRSVAAVSPASASAGKVGSRRKAGSRIHAQAERFAGGVPRQKVVQMDGGGGQHLMAQVVERAAVEGQSEIARLDHQINLLAVSQGIPHRFRTPKRLSDPDEGEVRKAVAVGHHAAKRIDAVEHQGTGAGHGDQLGEMALEPVVPAAGIGEQIAIGNAVMGRHEVDRMAPLLHQPGAARRGDEMGFQRWRQALGDRELAGQMFEMRAVVAHEEDAIARRFFDTGAGAGEGRFGEIGGEPCQMRCPAVASGDHLPLPASGALKRDLVTRADCRRGPPNPKALPSGSGLSITAVTPVWAMTTTSSCIASNIG